MGLRYQIELEKNKMEKIRIGVIGVGNMGKNHVRLLSEMKEDFELCGVYDPEKERVKNTGYTGKNFESEDELMSGVDAVVIAAPSFLHKSLVLKAAEYKLHVLVEKPLALDAGDAAEVCEKYKSLKNKILMVGHVERFNPVVQELEKILSNEEIIAVTLERCSPMDRRINDTDVIYDLMIHDIDILLNAIVPDIRFEKLHAFGKTVYNEKNVDFVQGIFKFENKVQASVISSRTTEDKIRKINVHCKDAFVDCDLLHKIITISRRTHYRLDTGYNPVYKQENVIEKVFVPNVEPLRAELSCFFESIRKGKALRNNGETAKRDLEVLDKIKQLVYNTVV